MIFGVKYDKEVTFSFLRTFGIGEVRAVPSYAFKAQNQTGCFFVYWRCSGDTLAGQPSQKVFFSFKSLLKLAHFEASVWGVPSGWLASHLRECFFLLKVF